MLIDEATLVQLRQGSDIAWTALANAIRARWGGKTEHAVGRADAEDLLQEVFVRIFSQIEQISDAEHLDRLVTCVWRHRVIDFHRRRTKGPLFHSLSAPPDQQGEIPPDHDLPDPDKASDPRRRVMSKEFRGILEQTPLLSAEQRLAVVLRVLEDCSWAEIAGLLERNIDTVKTWYFRAVQLIGQELALGVYRDRPADFAEALSETQKQALDHLVRGLPAKKTAKALRLRVPELARLLAPAWEILGRAAQADWFKAL